MMTEEQYIAVYDLGQLRASVRILGDLVNPAAREACKNIHAEIQRLEKVVETMMHGEEE